jgi:trehalose 6-phosphate phosphatase
LAASQAEQLRTTILKLWTPLTSKYPFRILNFDAGVELMTIGRDKGNAVNDILGEVDGSAAVAYLGDDQTDEDAFRALKGKGLAVLIRPEFRPTDADVWLQPPAELIEFLEEWQRASGGNDE